MSAPGNAIELSGLQRQFSEVPVLRDVSVSVPAGETLVVAGPNGCGKSTLLRILAGLLRPNGGETRVLGCELPKETWKLRGRIGYLGHDPLLYRDLSARENLRFAARLHGLERSAAEQRVNDLLDAVGMSHRADQRVAEYSAGMAQRTAICRAVLHEPELLLLDEPLSHLDSEACELVEALIGPSAGHTRVLVTHDAKDAAGAGRLLRLEAGGHMAAAVPA